MSNTQRALDAFFYTRLPPVLTRFLCVGGICIIVYLIKRCSVRRGVEATYVCQTRHAPLTPFSILAFPPFWRVFCVLVESVLLWIWLKDAPLEKASRPLAYVKYAARPWRLFLYSPSPSFDAFFVCWWNLYYCVFD